MTQYKIEKVPMPKSIRGGRKYPFKEMKAGESFAVESADVSKVRCSAYQFSHRNKPSAFRVLKIDDGTYRCFRAK